MGHSGHSTLFHPFLGGVLGVAHGVRKGGKEARGEAGRGETARQSSSLFIAYEATGGLRRRQSLRWWSRIWDAGAGAGAGISRLDGVRC